MATIGSAAWSEYVVYGGLANGIDPREPGFDWGSLLGRLGCSTPWCNQGYVVGTEVYHLNPALRDWAFHLSERELLADSPKAGFCQGSRHCPWPARAWLGIGPASHRGVDEDAVYRMWLGSRDRATRAHRSGLPPVPLPSLRQAVQRALRHSAEPDAVSLRRHRPRGALALALQAEPARPARDVRGARHRVQP